MRPCLIALFLVPAIMFLSPLARGASVRLTLVSAKLEKLKRKPQKPVMHVEVQDQVFRTPAAPDSLSPRWDYAIVLDQALIKGSRFVDFVLYDSDGPDDEQLIVGKRARPADLLRPGVRRLKLGAGEFVYKIEKLPEPGGDPAPPTPGKKGRGGHKARGPVLTGQQLVQQVVDEHGPDIEGCVGEEADPTGDLALLFTINPNGVPLGVVVEKAPPNLRKAGDCVRKKALAWKFPPPGSTLTARYTISLSQEH